MKFSVLRSAPLLAVFSACLIVPVPLSATPPAPANPPATATPPTPPNPGGKEILAPVGGALVFAVADGRAAKAGEALFVLDAGELLAKLAGLRDARSKAETEAAGLRAGAEKAVTEQTGRIAAAEAELRQAQRNLDRFIRLDQPATEAQLTQALADAEWTSRQEDERYQSRDKLLSDGIVGQVEYELMEGRWKRSLVAVQAARAKLDGHLQVEKPNTAEQLQAAAQAKSDALAALRAGAETAAKTLRDLNEAATRRATELGEQIAQAEREIRRRVVSAPSDGVVRLSDAAKAGPGTPVQPGQALATLTAK